MSGAEAGRKRELLVSVLLILGVSLFHGRGLQPGQAFLPVDLVSHNLPWRSEEWQPLQNWLISDPLYQFYPFLDHTTRTIKQSGQWPLWNPYIFLGHPTLADPLAQPFYPVFAILGAILGTARGLTIGLWLHTIMAALATYGFLRTIRCRRYAAAAGSFTYALSGYLVTWFETPFWTSTLSWLPVILWAFELAIRRRSLRYTALSAGAMALAILSGQFAFAVTFGLFLGFYALGRTLESARGGQSKPAWPFVVLAATLGVGALLSAIQILPFADFLSFSRRLLSEGLADPLPVKQLFSLLVPDFYGTPTTIAPYWGEMNYSEGTIYAGLSAFFLACLAPFAARRFFVSYLSLLTIAVILFILGAPGVQTLGSLPVLKYVSLHRSAFLLPLLVATLAALTLSAPRIPITAMVAVGGLLVAVIVMVTILNWGQIQGYWQELWMPLLRAIVLLLLTIVLLAIRNRLPRTQNLVGWSLVGLVFLDLFTFGSRFNPVGPLTDLMPPRPVTEYLATHTDPYRAVAYQISDVLFGPNVLSLYGVAEAGGYSSLVSTRLHQLVAAGDPEISVPWMDRSSNMVTFSHPSQRLLDLLQVAYVISPTPLSDPGVRAEIEAGGCLTDSGEITSGHTVSGSFRVRDSAINRMDLYLRVYQPGQTRGHLSIRMWQGQERKNLMLDTQVDTSGLKDQQAVPIYFAPEKDAPGQVYVWELGASEEGLSTGVGLCASADGQPSVSVYGADWSQEFQGRVYVFERLAPLPRAYVVYAAELISDDSQAVNRLLEETFDLRNTAVTAEWIELPAATDTPATRAEITTYGATEVVVKATASQPGLLILGDQYYPGWRAYIDGQPAPIIRVNHVLRGVALSPGEHEIQFQFGPASLRTGIWLSAFGLVLVALLMVIEKHPRGVNWLNHGQISAPDRGQDS